MYIANGAALDDLSSPEVTIGIEECQIVYIESGTCVAKGLVDIVHWLSFRASSSEQWRSTLCGTTKEEKRKIARGLRRVMSWESDWADFITSPCEQLSNALCGPVLFDKRLRHRGMKYILDYTPADC